MALTIHVIIVTYNGIRWIGKCLESVVNSIAPLFPLVIDNNSTDSTVQYIKTRFPQINIIENKRNLGFGKANNIGIQYALDQNAHYILLLNQDAWLKPDTVEKLINAHRNYPSYGIISPIQLNAKGVLDQNFSSCLSQRSLDRIKQTVNGSSSFLEHTSFVNAACWLLPLQCIQKVGEFDPLFKHYGEDRDYCNRSIYHGFKIGILHSSCIYHDRIYAFDNKFRKYSNILYSIGLAKLKDINKPFLINLFNLQLERGRKIFKAIIHLHTKSIISEVFILFQLILLTPKILQSRKYCKKPFLRNSQIN